MSIAETQQFPRNPAPLPETPPATASRQMDREVVEIFAELASILGNAPSVGGIYGLLFLSKEPLDMEEIIRRLGISKGSASQGLRELQRHGVIHGIKADGERRQRYVAELELKRLLAGFLKERLVPRLKKGSERLEKLNQLLPHLPESQQANARERLGKLSTWHHRASSALPLFLGLLKEN